jgi:hypothetical protein
MHARKTITSKGTTKNGEVISISNPSLPAYHAMLRNLIDLVADFEA